MIDFSNADILWKGSLLTAPLAMLAGYYLLVNEQRQRERNRRLDEYRGAVKANQQAPRGPTWTDQIATSLAPIIGIVEQERLGKLLISAGYRGEVPLANFIAAKAFAAVILMVGAWLFPFSMLLLKVGLLGVAVLVGWRLPDIILGQMVSRRRLRIEQGMPDALDLMVICAEAGLSLNQAVENISHQLIRSNKDIADEFAFTSAEMQVLPDFGKALDNLVERTGLINLRSLVATLKQSLKLGTPLAESLRIIAAEMRLERNARMEERAAKLPVILSVPMLLFILPCIFLIVGTPVFIRAADTFKNISFGAPR